MLLLFLKNMSLMKFATPDILSEVAFLYKDRLLKNKIRIIKTLTKPITTLSAAMVTQPSSTSSTSEKPRTKDSY